VLKNSIKNLVFIVFAILLLQGCGKNKFSFKNLVTSNNAIQIQKNYTHISKLLVKYKKMLDVRNPYSYDKTLKKAMIKDILSQKNNIQLNGLKNNHNLYIKKAFNKSKDIKYRNDFLILGLYKLMFFSYDMSQKKLTALGYNLKNLEKLGKILQLIRWKIKTAKTKNKKYLFLTWQTNWQVEFMRKTNIKNPNYCLIKNLKYIKNKKENIFGSSNMEFENIISKISYINNDSIIRLGGEPDELSLSALKLFMFL
jgi:hypothetical protein